MPKISIITTTHKHEKFIAQTIESILAQKHTDRELLIGDDSPDNMTREIIQSYVAKYPDKIKTRHHHPNKGIIDNMNFLLEKVASKSEYIAFLEWDDMYTSDNLEKKIRIFEKYSEVQAVMSCPEFIDAYSNRKKVLSVFTPEWYRKTWIRNLSKVQMIENIVPPVRSFWCAMIRKKIYIQNKIKIYNPSPNEKTFIPYDYLFWIQILSNENIYFLKEKVWQYRIHGNNLSINDEFEKWLWQYKIIFSIATEKDSKLLIYMHSIIDAKIFALQWKKMASVKKLITSIFLFPLKHIIYKLSIIFNLLYSQKIKKKLISLLSKFNFMNT